MEFFTPSRIILNKELIKQVCFMWWRDVGGEMITILKYLKKIYLDKLNKVPLGIWIQVTEIRKTWNFTGSKEDLNWPQYGRNQGSSCVSQHQSLKHFSLAAPTDVPPHQHPSLFPVLWRENLIFQPTSDPLLDQAGMARK